MLPDKVDTRNTKDSLYSHISSCSLGNNIFLKKLVSMCKFYLHTKCHMPNSHGSLLIAIMLNAIYRFHFTKTKLIKVAHSSDLRYHTQPPGPLFLTHSSVRHVGKQNVQAWCSFPSHNMRTKFHQNLFNGTEFWTRARTNRHELLNTYVHFMRIVQRPHNKTMAWWVDFCSEGFRFKSRPGHRRSSFLQFL